VAHWIADVIDAKCAEEVVQRVRELVLKLCRRFPVYVANVAKARQ
jgi:glycine/serine hydroxymethyltransferase